MKIAGHKTRSVFDRYDVTSDRDVKNAGARQETYLAGQIGKSLGKVVDSEPLHDYAKSLQVN